ncbi:MAG TPA: hypothetical protein EYP04_03955 [Anaerolineae bacterium]|nr:hypothetical protein [Anaerolineae bacterium]
MESLLLQRLKRELSEEGFEQIFLKLDLLHDLASFGLLTQVTSLPLEQIRGWLEEFIFTARETLQELDQN